MQRRAVEPRRRVIADELSAINYESRDSKIDRNVALSRAGIIK